MDKIWVIGWDYGTEGKCAPEMAFKTQAEAEYVRDFVGKNPSATQTYIAEVPIWSPLSEG